MTKIDSIFEYFEDPRLPDELFGTSGAYKGFWAHSFHILCQIDVKDNGKVKNIISSPAYNIGNNVPQENKIWKSLISSIDSASKKWLFKRVYWQINHEDTTFPKSWYDSVNTGKMNCVAKPFGCLYSVLLLIEFKLPYWDNEVSLFYFIQSHQDEK